MDINKFEKALDGIREGSQLRRVAICYFENFNEYIDKEFLTSSTDAKHSAINRYRTHLRRRGFVFKRGYGNNFKLINIVPIEEKKIEIVKPKQIERPRFDHLINWRSTLINQVFC